MQERKGKHEAFVNAFLDKRKAEQKAIKKKQDFYKRVEKLMEVDPHIAEAYIQTQNKF